jgi:hypothetical protein
MNLVLQICSKKGCDSIAEFKGYCRKHAKIEFPKVFNATPEIKAKMKVIIHD